MKLCLGTPLRTGAYLSRQFSFCVTQLMTLDSHMSAPSGIVYSTNPRKAEAVNGKTYVVKGPELETVFAELAGCMLAATVGIPVPPVAVCVADDEKLQEARMLSKAFEMLRFHLDDQPKLSISLTCTT